MEKPVYYEGDPADNPTKYETRTYEVKIQIVHQFVELEADEKHEMYEMKKRLEKLLVSHLGKDYYPEVIEASRTTEVEFDEHIPTLEHILTYIGEKGDRETRRFAAEKAGALYKRVYGNQIW